ncbi:helix-turn-helix domain-containing protein [Bacillus thuringiensis]|uniref:helix-turn-helix domain-containing protein n=1 Tax=Bacillus thuringiensis TaxID=1428 RepID=UPI003458BE0D
MRALLPEKCERVKHLLWVIGANLHALYNKEKARDSEVQLILVHKAYKLHSYPNLEQQVLLTKTFSCSCFVFNYLLLYGKVYTKKQRKE